MRQLIICLTLWLLAGCGLSAQKVMLLERAGKVRSQKIHIGSRINYQLRGDKTWHTHRIEDYLIEQRLIQAADRYIPVDSITVIRFDRRAARNLSRMLQLFGTSWSTFALLGTATDGDPDTRYRAGDAIVTATAVGTGTLLPTLFGIKKFKVSNRKRLRLLDLRTFSTGEAP